MSAIAQSLAGGWKLWVGATGQASGHAQAAPFVLFAPLRCLRNLL